MTKARKPAKKSVRTTTHEVMRGRKGGPHKTREQKRDSKYPRRYE